MMSVNFCCQDRIKIGVSKKVHWLWSDNCLYQKSKGKKGLLLPLFQSLCISELYLTKYFSTITTIRVFVTFVREQLVSHWYWLRPTVLYCSSCSLFFGHPASTISPSIASRRGSLFALLLGPPPLTLNMASRSRFSNINHLHSVLLLSCLACCHTLPGGKEILLL